MTTTRSRLRTRFAAVVAGALATGGLVALAPAAHAADPAPATFQWKISQQFVNSLPVHTTGDGATEDETSRVVTFGAGQGSYNPANGAATVSYSGWVQGAFKNASCPGDGTPGDTTCYWVRFANPTVTVDGEGHGSITAEVTSRAYLAAGGVDPGGTDTQRVLVTTFDADESDWTAGATADDNGSLTATPHWENVLTAGSPEALDAGITNTAHPVDNSSFAQPLIKQLYPSVKSHFYKSNASQPNKVPAEFTAQAAAMTVSKTITAVSPTNGLTVRVNGTGFRGVTNPGDAGVYVGIAEAGGLPDVSSPSGMGAFAAAAYVPAGQIVNGAFAATMTAPTDKLDSGETYAIYTWQAHTHSNVTQDTETALPINFGQLENAPEVEATIVEQNAVDGVEVEVSGSHFVAATNPDDAGVYVGIAPAGGLPDVSSPGGQSAFAVAAYIPALPTGSFTRTLTAPIAKLDTGKAYAVYTWQAHTHSNTSQDTVTALPITWSQVQVSGPAAASVGTPATFTVALPAGATGSVTVSEGGKQLGVVTATAGKATYVANALAVGQRTLTFAYAGDGGNLPGVATASISVGKVATTAKAKVTKKPTLKKAGKVKVTIGSGVDKPSGKVTITLKKGKKTKTVKGTVKNGVVVVKIKKKVAKKLGKGKWKVTVAYQGDATHAPSTTTFKLKVKKK